MSEIKTTTLKIAGVVGGVLLAALIGAGLWFAANPPTPPLQGQADARTIEVAPKISGRIASVSVREGDMVNAGDILMNIEIPELTAKLDQVRAQQVAAEAKARILDDGARKEQIAAAKAQYERAQSGLTLARQTYRRVDALFKDGLVSAQKHDEAHAALENAVNLTLSSKSAYELAVNGTREDEKKAAHALASQAAYGVAEVSSLASEAEVRAPRTGEVSRVVLHPGEIAPAGFPLVTLLDHSDKWVVFNIREDELVTIKMGTELHADVPALGLKDSIFKVYWISPRADYATWRSTRQSTGYDVRTFEVRARPADDMPDLRPGMSVIVNR